MAIKYYDKVVYQTDRPGLETVRWRKLTIVAGSIVEVTTWSVEGVYEVEPGNYFFMVPIEDTDPALLLISMDTGEAEPFSRVIPAVGFDPNTLVDVKSGGGVLSARIAESSLAPSRYLEVVQGEEKTITFIVEAIGRFEQPSADEIEVRMKDVKGNVVTIENDAIERVCEELDVQIIRCVLSAEDSATLHQGLLKIEIAFDDQKARLNHSLKIVQTV